MSRDAAGNWIPLAPVVGGTVITSTWANNMMTSFGADVTESLDRSGRGGMLVPLRIASGTKLEPGYSWTAELSTGFYRPLGGFDMRTSIGGVDIFRWNANGAQISPDDGVTWEQIITEGSTGRVPVDAGTVEGQVLRWDESTTKTWQATSALLIDASGTSLFNGTLKAQIPKVPIINIKNNGGENWLAPAILATTVGTSSDPAPIMSCGTRADGNVRTKFGGNFTACRSFDILTPPVGVALGTYSFGANTVASGDIKYTAAIVARTEAAWTGDTDAPTYMTFNTTAVGEAAGIGGGGTSDPGFERMRIDSAGNVGIGVTPATQLEVLSASTTKDILRVRATGGKGLYLYSSATIIGLFDTASAGAGRSGMQIATNTVSFDTNAAERMRIDDTGRVGIGTLSPQATLHVAGNAAITLDGVNDGALISAPAGVFDDSVVYGFYFNSLTGISHPGSDIIGFKTANAERMRIDSSGLVYIGKTVTDIAVAGTYFTSDGAMVITRPSNLCMALNRTGSDGTVATFSNDGTQVGSISFAGTVTSYNTSSDVRLKENIQDAVDPFAKINAIQVREFDWKADGSHQDFGFIAQELVEVAPEAVSKGETEEDTWGVDPSKLVPLLTAAIQELTARVEALGG